MHDKTPATITVWSPASLSNIGPGFDTIGLAITGFGDKVVGRITGEGAPSVSIVSTGFVTLPTEASANTAGVAANFVLTRANARVTIELEIEKGIPLGSGIGGSAASAVAGAFAANALIGHPFHPEELVSAAIEGEAVASGAEHGDNVVPSLLGGLFLVSPENPRDFRALPVADGLQMVVVLPDLQIMTSSARMILPENVSHQTAVHNAANLAFLMTAFGSGDWHSVGKHIMTDRLAEPFRARLLPGYDHMKQAALTHGALGAALSGSGPAMFAVVDSTETADAVLRAMTLACTEAGMKSSAKIVEVDRAGTRLI